MTIEMRVEELIQLDVEYKVFTCHNTYSDMDYKNLTENFGCEFYVHNDILDLLFPDENFWKIINILKHYDREWKLFTLYDFKNVLYGRNQK